MSRILLNFYTPAKAEAFEKWKAVGVEISCKSDDGAEVVLEFDKKKMDELAISVAMYQLADFGIARRGN